MKQEPAPKPARTVQLVRASHVEPERLSWLWHLRIVLGGLTLLAGREGLGKSTVAVELAARVTRGQLEGALEGRPADVLYVHTEDDRAATIVPRLMAAGADLDRVHFVDAREGGLGDRLTFPRDMTRLDDVLTLADVSPALVVLDAATSTLDGQLDGNSDREIRRGLEALAHFATEWRAAVLGIVHFGKRESADSGKLILGSIAWSQVARSVLSLAKDEDAGHLVITATKGNLSTTSTSVACQLVSVDVETPEGPTSVGRVDWIGETPQDARDLLAGRPMEGPPTATQDAAAWLRGYLLQHGPEVPAGEALEAFQAAGMTGGTRTLQRARKKAGVRTRQTADGWLWSLEAGDTAAPVAWAVASPDLGRHPGDHMTHDPADELDGWAAFERLTAGRMSA